MRMELQLSMRVSISDVTRCNNVLPDTASELEQPSKMVVAGARHLVHVTLHLQLTVQNDAQVTNKTGRVNSGTGNGELKVW